MVDRPVEVTRQVGRCLGLRHRAVVSGPELISKLAFGYVHLPLPGLIRPGTLIMKLDQKHQRSEVNVVGGSALQEWNMEGGVGSPGILHKFFASRFLQ